MSIRGTMVSGTVLSATEFWDLLCARYNVSPLNLQSYWNVCGTAFSVTHALICSTGCLVIVRHNEIRDKLFYLSQRAFTPALVSSKTLICQGCTISEKDIHQGSNKDKETRGDVIIKSLWYQQDEAIIDVKIEDADKDDHK